MHVTGSHDPLLVALSILIAVVSSYAALDLAGRIKASSGWASLGWLSTAALALGGGIWSMHFIAMLAYALPGLAVRFDPGLTAVSFVLPIGVTALGFYLVNRPASTSLTLAVSGMIMGLGIAGMHYTGMEAMRVEARLHYDPAWAALSVVIAIGAATAALWLAKQQTRPAQRVLAAAVMGVAIAGMHYTAMKAASFHATTDFAVDQAGTMPQDNLALAIAAATFLILVAALIAAMFDRRLAVLAEREAAALKRSEEEFRTLYSKTPLPLYALDAQDRIVNVSDAWLDLMGFDAASVIGRPISAFMTESSAAQRAVDAGHLKAAGQLLGASSRLVARDGDCVDALLSERLELDENGEFLRVLGGMTDVTALRRAEDTLRQAQKMESIGQLTGGVAHDFNNLLAVVFGNLELLRKRVPDGSDLIGLIDGAMQGAQRGRALTQRMLAFARRQDLKPEPVDIPSLVRGMEDLLQRSIGPQVQIETRFPLASARALVDANQLELALLNLVVNARDAMPEGGTVTIGLRIAGNAPTNVLAAEPGQFLCLSVEDTGHGMDEPTLARVCEPFFTTKGVGKGTGLGLSMVHGFAEQSGGRFEIRSRWGEGTVAEIWLPVAATVSNDNREAPPVEIARDSRSLVVLVVDDDALVRMNTALLLEDLGHRVLEAASGAEALALLDGQDVDLLITDQSMPRMTGIQLAESVRQRRPALPILVATGYAELPSTVQLPRISKPFDQAELARAVAACLGEDRSLRA